MTEKHENLLAAYFSGQISDIERAELLSLIETDKEISDCFREMQEAYISACIPQFEKTKGNDFQIVKERISGRRARVSFWKPLAVAASVAVVALIGLAINLGHKYHDAECFLCESDVLTITSKNGTGTETTLPDGTRVCLNAASSLSFNRHFGRYTRDVNLDGEGYFEVTSDASKPFRVHAGNACVTVKGTKFNVRSYSDEIAIAVSLIEGSVMLNTDSGMKALLKPGSCAVVNRENGSLRVEKADPFAADWTKGKFVFTDKSIPEILHSVERNYAVRFVYADDLFGNERFTGKISSNLSIDEILSYIDVDKKYRWVKREDTIQIYKK